MKDLNSASIILIGLSFFSVSASCLAEETIICTSKDERAEIYLKADSDFRSGNSKATIYTLRIPEKGIDLEDERGVIYAHGKFGCGEGPVCSYWLHSFTPVRKSDALSSQIDTITEIAITTPGSLRTTRGEIDFTGGGYLELSCKRDGN